MKILIRGVRSEILKMKHTFLLPFHAAIPILGSTIFLMYYRFAGWSEISQISGYMEIIGVALPFVVSIVCAGNIALEEQQHFQLFLGNYKKKQIGFGIKCLVLAGMGFLAICSAVALFGAGYYFVLGKEGLSVSMYMCLTMLLFLGSIPLYLEHLFLNLMFPKTVSQCAGVAQSLLAALFLTGLGEGRWQFFPCSWSSRGTMLMLFGLYPENVGSMYFSEVKRTAAICLLLLLLICAIIGIWFHFYEGRQCND